MIKNKNEDLDADVLHLALGTLDVQLMVAGACAKRWAVEVMRGAPPRPEDAAVTAVRCD